MRVAPFFRWYDLWVGAYWDHQSRTLYVCPVPMLGLRVRFAPRVRPCVCVFHEGKHGWCGSQLCECWLGDRP